MICNCKKETWSASCVLSTAKSRNSCDGKAAKLPGTRHLGFPLTGMKQSNSAVRLPASRLLKGQANAGGATTNVGRRQMGERSASSPDALLASAFYLQAGDLVIHADHGLGRYEGLTTLDADGRRDFFTIAYRDGKVLVPAENADLLSR